MKGIVLASHAGMADGLLDALTMFFGDDIHGICSVGLRHGMGVDDFKKQLVFAIDSVDEGDGVIIFTDMFGGTPCNQALLFANDHTKVIAGMNLPLLMEYLASRDQDIDHLLEKAKSSLMDASAFLLQDHHDDDDD